MGEKREHRRSDTRGTGTRWVQCNWFRSGSTREYLQACVENGPSTVVLKGTI